jgi:acyl-coenzyme A thioesterase PaaI-like protein
MAFAAQSNGECDSGCATVDCSVQYLSAARSGPFVCTVVTTLKTTRTAFVRGEIRDANGQPVAMAQGTFRLFSTRKDGTTA